MGPGVEILVHCHTDMASEIEYEVSDYRRNVRFLLALPAVLSNSVYIFVLFLSNK